jgi:hypothetical protein
MAGGLTLGYGMLVGMAGRERSQPVHRRELPA